MRQALSLNLSQAGYSTPDGGPSGHRAHLWTGPATSGGAGLYRYAAGARGRLSVHAATGVADGEKRPTESVGRTLAAREQMSNWLTGNKARGWRDDSSGRGRMLASSREQSKLIASKALGWLLVSRSLIVASRWLRHENGKDAHMVTGAQGVNSRAILFHAYSVSTSSSINCDLPEIGQALANSPAPEPKNGPGFPQGALNDAGLRAERDSAADVNGHLQHRRVQENLSLAALRPKSTYRARL